MDLFPDNDDALVKYCLTLENEQKVLHADLLHLRQELNNMQNELYKSKVRSAFIMKNCDITYDIKEFFLTTENESIIESWIKNLQNDLEGIEASTFYASENTWAGHRRDKQLYHSQDDDTLFYHKYAVKVVVTYSQSRYLAKYNKDNPDFNPELHMLAISISVNPMTMLTYDDVLNKFTSVNPTHGQPWRRLKQLDEYNLMVVFDLHFDGKVIRSETPGRLGK